MAAMQAPKPDLKVKRAIASIRRFHAIGLQSLKRVAKGKFYGNLKAEALDFGLNPEMLRQARNTADPHRGYTPKQLDTLCHLCEIHGAAFGPSHLYRLVTVPKARREAFQRMVTRQRCSRKALDHEIRKKFGSQRPSPRRPETPETVEDAVILLRLVCERWLRLHEVLAMPATAIKGNPARSLVERMGRPVKQSIDQAHEAVEKLTKQLTLSMLS